MSRRFLSSFAWAREIAHHPIKILWLALAGAAVGVVLDGTAIRLWSLHREHDQIQGRIAAAKTRSKTMEFRIHQAASSEFIERAARDQFDLVKEGDLVFIFADGSPETTDKTENSFN